MSSGMESVHLVSFGFGGHDASAALTGLPFSKIMFFLTRR